jgi:hypothetical protein
MGCRFNFNPSIETLNESAADGQARYLLRAAIAEGETKRVR